MGTKGEVQAAAAQRGQQERRSCLSAAGEGRAAGQLPALDVQCLLCCRPGGATLLVSLQMHCNRNLAFTLARSPPLPAFAASKKVTLTLKPSVVGSKLPPITCLQVGWGRRWELEPAALAARAAASPCGIDTRTDR